VATQYRRNADLCITMNKEFDMEHQDRSAHTGRGKWVLVGFLAVAAFFLWTEHRAHLLGALPYLLLLACPLMHMFHHGHGSHGHHHGNHEKSDARQPSQVRNRAGEES
jgi:hypothetical protein